MTLGNKEILSINIKYYLSKNGLNPSDLADKLGLRRTTVYDWVNGKTYPRIDKLEMLARFFNINKSDLVEQHNPDGTTVLDDIYKTSKQLIKERQQNVYKYANTQLEEQNNTFNLVNNNITQIKLYGAVSAGTGEYMIDNKPELIDYTGKVPTHDFAVQVNGNSMTPLFDDKQIIFVNKTNEARSGQIVIADYDGQAYVKKFMHDDISCRLVSLNKNYQDLPIDDSHELSIFGVVIL
ncbi:XRE family transcriptional regulator [Convivina intestini]|uniref:XRE family transcriptional regulator n=1 Tax=Convivina intestini TaxID=1505726 RepID=UPI00200C9F3A|nr:XRE family transcriptional regulator [Convivina intestini]CAH1855699.1 LexA repressor [Convivina intestini]